MNRDLPRFVGFWLAGLLLASASGAQPAPVDANPAQSTLASDPSVASNLRLLEASITGKMAHSGLPGLSIGIVYDQELVWARGFGYADVAGKKAATPRTLYRVASLTKTFTATAVMQLRDAGKLQLDDRVSTYLPWFEVQGETGEAPITIRELMTHTSGLTRDGTTTYWTDFNFPARDELVAGLASEPLSFPPATRLKYSNLAVSIEGELVAAVSGESYEDYITRRILIPLGMKDSTIAQKPDAAGLLATGYGRRLPDGTRALFPYIDAKGITPAAGLAANVEDLAKFVSLQFREDRPASGNPVLKGSSLREMHRMQWMLPNWKAGWALGFSTYRQGDATFIGHGGSYPGYITSMRISPADKIGIIVLTNAVDGKAGTVARQAFELIAPALRKANAKTKAVPVVDRDQDRFVGRYRSLWDDVQILPDEGGLVIVDPENDDLKESLYRLVPIGDGSYFKEANDPSNTEDHKIVKFRFDSTRNVIGMTIGASYYERLR